MNDDCLFWKKLLRILRFAIREQRFLPPIIFQRFICSPFIYSRVHMALRISFVPYLILFWNAQDAASLWNSILRVFLFSYRRNKHNHIRNCAMELLLKNSLFRFSHFHTNWKCCRIFVRNNVKNKWSNNWFWWKEFL